MSIEEIIENLSLMADVEDDLVLHTVDTDVKLRLKKNADTYRQAIALLKSHPEAQPNEPLTLEELREMDGEPVWIKKGLEICEWAIVLGREDLYHLHFAVLRGQIRLAPKEYGAAWLAYRRPPEKEE